MKTVGQKVAAFNVVGVKPGFNHHEENGVSAFEPITAASFCRPASSGWLSEVRAPPGRQGGVLPLG